MSTIQILVAVWPIVGVAIVVSLSTRDELADYAALVAAVVLWPVVLVCKAIVWRRDRRREIARQARIATKVTTGEYTLEQAERLNWKGAGRG